MDDIKSLALGCLNWLEREGPSPLLQVGKEN